MAMQRILSIYREAVVKTGTTPPCGDRTPRRDLDEGALYHSIHVELLDDFS
jgi:hypothetical protein